MATCYLVLGTPRSGTSCVSGILHKLGVRMSLGDFVPASPANPTGFWEDAEFVRSLFAPIPFDLTLVQEYQLNVALRGLISNRHAPSVDWGAKTCQLAFCLDAWMSTCNELGITVKTIMTSRDIIQSKASWRNAFNSDDSIIDIVGELIAPYQVNSLIVPFDDLLNNTSTTIISIASFCGKPSQGTAFDDAVAFVDPSLRNYP